MGELERHAGAVSLRAELRLRRWARENYVPDPAHRDASWHPVVLDEMRRKDCELEEQAARKPLASTYVPLVPTSLHAIHPAHPADFAPHYVHELSETQLRVPDDAASTPT